MEQFTYTIVVFLFLVAKYSFCFCCVQDFEVRLYGATDWITTKLDSTRIRDYLAANSRLKTYVKRQAEAGT